MGISARPSSKWACYAVANVRVTFGPEGQLSGSNQPFRVMRIGGLEAAILMGSITKDPAKVAAGRLGASKRWGDTPKTVRLDDLTAEQRRLVLALVAAARSDPEKAVA